MSRNFSIDHKKHNGDLYIHPSGDFDGSSAWELINFLHEKYDGKGRVFVDTHNLHKVCPFGCATFQGRLNLSRVPANRLVFKGEKGLDMAPNGSNVIVRPQNHQCRCTGNCANCPCSGDKKRN